MGEKELTILDQSVIQINPLMEAKKCMNVTEMRLFVLGLQGVRPHITDDYGYEYDLEFRETIIPANQLTILLGDNYGKVANIKKQLERAYDSKIVLNYKDGGFEFKHIYDIMKYEPERGLIIKFDNKMKPYILEVVGQQYTKYKVKALFVLTSAYAWRILELLFTKQGYFKKGYQQVYIEYDIEKLREILNVIDEYKKTTDFRKYVLDEPIAQINERTDYYVWYEKIKVGRRIKKIKIYMKLKETDNDKKEIAPIANEQPPQLTSSVVTKKPKDDFDEAYIDELFKCLENLDDIPEWTPPAEQPPQITSLPVVVPAEHSAGVALLKTIGINPPSSSMTANEKEEKPVPAPAKVSEWSEEQQADYDLLLQCGVWPKTAKMFVAGYDHEQIKRNIQGCVKSTPKGNIRDLGAVIVNAITNDTYKGSVEEQAQALERDQARRKAEWEQSQKEIQAKHQAETDKIQKLAEIRAKKSRDEIIAVFDNVMAEYNRNKILTPEMVAELEKNGIPQKDFISYTREITRKTIKYLQ